jgi:single-strand DNA-binding protein
MSKFRNHVQLIGNMGDDPTVTNLDSGKKVAKFQLATNERYKNANGETVQNTDWHSIVAWGKTAEIVEQFGAKGREVGINGKLKSRHFETKEGNMRYVTEVVANEILLLGSRS